MINNFYTVYDHNGIFIGYAECIADGVELHTQYYKHSPLYDYIGVNTKNGTLRCGIIQPVIQLKQKQQAA